MLAIPITDAALVGACKAARGLKRRGGRNPRTTRCPSKRRDPSPLVPRKSAWRVDRRAPAVREERSGLAPSRPAGPCAPGDLAQRLHRTRDDSGRTWCASSNEEVAAVVLLGSVGLKCGRRGSDGNPLESREVGNDGAERPKSRSPLTPSARVQRMRMAIGDAGAEAKDTLESVSAAADRPTITAMAAARGPVGQGRGPGRSDGADRQFGHRMTTFDRAQPSRAPDRHDSGAGHRYVMAWRIKVGRARRRGRPSRA